jgi:hypothetical protein
MVAGAAVQKLMMTLSKEQEILMNIADMAIITYHAESALLRLEKLTAQKGEARNNRSSRYCEDLYLRCKQMLLTKQVKMH